MARASLRDQILDAGLKVMFRKGYVGSGVRDIVAEASAPQGSFTNHFRSKERFAREVLDRYFEHIRALVAQALDDTSRSPRERLRRYLDTITERLAADGFTRGCLIGDFSLEAAPVQQRCLRERLAAIFAEWRAPFAACIAEAQAAGEVETVFDPDDLAEFLLASWEGAILRMKVERRPNRSNDSSGSRLPTVFKEDHDHDQRHHPAHAAGARFHDRVSRSRSRRRAGRAVPAWQSDVVLHLASHHAACRAGSRTASRRT